MLTGIAMLGAETARTRAYLVALRDSKLLPSDMVLLEQLDNRGMHGIADLAHASGMRVVRIVATGINEPDVVTAVAALAQTYVIFSGPAGAIVRQRLFATGKKFIHVHPGRLPDFRGSTTIYYSLLAENKVEATALFLDEVIDAGPVIGRAQFDAPADRREIDAGYDANIRAKLLVDVMRNFATRGAFADVPQPKQAGKTFYIIHPVLKHLAILAK
jgi:methionyl-tRNA formyltransferase